MKLKKKPVIIATVSALAISGSIFANSTYASQATQQLKAAYNNIKVMYNSKEVAIDPAYEPFMVNGTTYIPLRMMGDAFDKKVTWDNTNKIVSVADNTPAIPQTTVDSLNAQIQSLQTQLTTANSQITAKDASITDLNNQIATLKKENEKLNDEIDDKGGSSSTTMTRLEKDLNSEYGDYKGTGADIDLSGSSSKVKVTITVNENSWNDTSTSNRNKLLQGIADDIRDNRSYDSANITGNVVNKNSKTLITFKTNSSGTVVLGSTVNLTDLQKQLNDSFGTYQGIKLSLEVSNSDDESVVFRVYVNKSDWNSLSSYQTRNVLNSIASDIDKAYGNLGFDIYGFVYDSSNRSSVIQRYE
ncbi:MULTISPECIES: stalk domain-containing protein [Paenibacillus]|uniref:stalk domain-containing protein n=1 Tax=Paenibacillus TaxID=44249 RepID=UPI00037C9478|nr:MULTISPECIES: stalk domain-containing protein [Paenibacillus]